MFDYHLSKHEEQLSAEELFRRFEALHKDWRTFLLDEYDITISWPKFVVDDSSNQKKTSIHVYNQHLGFENIEAQKLYQKKFEEFQIETLGHKFTGFDTSACIPATGLSGWSATPRLTFEESRVALPQQKGYKRYVSHRKG